MHVLPKRNNAQVNNTRKSPLLVIAHGESADFRLFRNMFSKKFLYLEEEKEYSKAVSNLLIETTAIRAVQAYYVLLGLDCAISTSTVPRSKLNNALITDKLHLSTWKMKNALY